MEKMITQEFREAYPKTLKHKTHNVFFLPITKEIKFTAFFCEVLVALASDIKMCSSLASAVPRWWLRGLNVETIWCI